ncbi:thioredoxin domain-containing protein 6 [Chamberlinius hualienensis]
MHRIIGRRFLHQDHRLELTLALIKPDATSSPHVIQRIRDRILNEGFYIIRTKKCQMTFTDAQAFYYSHRDKFFYNRLVTFMSSGPLYAHLLAQNDAITNWRKIMGPTKTYRAQYEAPESIRGQFGLTDTRNAVHGSDSSEAMREESKFFFPEFDHSNWEELEKQFRTGNVVFDKDLFQHQLENSLKNKSLKIF